MDNEWCIHKITQFRKSVVDKKKKRKKSVAGNRYFDCIFIPTTFLLQPSSLEFILSTCFTQKLLFKRAYATESNKPSKLRFHKNP